MEREEKKRKREEEKKKKQPKRKRRPIPESSSDENDENVTVRYNESDCSYDERNICPGCKTDDGSPDEWIKCTICPLSWHVTCTGDAVVMEIPTDQLSAYPFHCEYCL